MPVLDSLRAAVKRLDDWYSTAIGLGGSSDKVAGVTFRWGSVLDWNQLDALYHQDALAARIVDAVPQEALREGFRVVVAADLPEEDDPLEEAVKAAEGDEPADAKPAEAEKVPRRSDAFPPKPFGAQPKPGDPPDPNAPPPGPPPPPPNPEAMRAKAEATRKKLKRLLAEREANKEASELADKVMARLRELGGQEKLCEAWIWGRLFGGGLLIVGAEDGRLADQPLAEDSIKTIRFLEVIDRRYVSILKWDTDPASNRFGLPDLYQISSDKPTSDTPLRQIHASRVIAFGGARTSSWVRLLNSGWDLSVLDRIYQQLRRYSASVAATSQLVQDSSQAVYRMKGLWALVAGNEGDTVKARIEILERSRSVLRAMLLDTDEEFTREAATYTGLPEVLEILQQDLVASLGGPMTFWFGRSPAGMNATGESDYRTLIDFVRGEQTGTLKPRAERLVQLIMLAKDGPTGGKEPENWELIFNPLRQPTPEESAAIQKQVAEGDKLWLELGIPKAHLIRSHFRSEGFSAGLDLDAEAIVAEMEQAEAERLEQGADAAEQQNDQAAAEGDAAKKKAEDDKAADAALAERIRARQAAKGSP